MRKRGWCASHYGQWRTSGEEPKPFAWRWAAPELCRVCGSPPAYGFRYFCSGACAVLWRKFGGHVPLFRECVGCGKRIDLTKRGKGGQRVREDIKLCRRCRIDKRKHGMSVEQLAKRDGINCGICGKPVNMRLRKGDPESKWRASVDHVIPRAKGGTNDPANLQLAHLCCNQTKRDRLDFVA
jgi:5-methylcytosine-specific restriction endonuclease McrA